MVRQWSLNLLLALFLSFATSSLVPEFASADPPTKPGFIWVDDGKVPPHWKRARAGTGDSASPLKPAVEEKKNLRPEKEIFVRDHREPPAPISLSVDVRVDDYGRAIFVFQFYTVNRPNVASDSLLNGFRVIGHEQENGRFERSKAVPFTHEGNLKQSKAKAHRSARSSGYKHSSRYCFAVESFDLKGRNSPISNPVCVETGGWIEAASNLKILALSNDSIEIKFSDNSNDEMYFIFYWSPIDSLNWRALTIQVPDWIASTGTRRIRIPEGTGGSFYVPNTGRYKFKVGAARADLETTADSVIGYVDLDIFALWEDKQSRVLNLKKEDLSLRYMWYSSLFAIQPATLFSIKLDAPSQVIALIFPKAGFTTLDCDDSAATHTVKNGSSLSGSELRSLFEGGRLQTPPTLGIVACGWVKDPNQDGILKRSEYPEYISVELTYKKND